jgi:predicted ArsR family transcriptional regulator
VGETTPNVRREWALAHESRVALIKVLQESEAPMDASELAEAVGLHVNTVRSHLRALERAELVRRQAEPRVQPARPRQLFTATVSSVPDGRERYGLLARMLASYVAMNATDPVAASEETGRQWGRYLVPSREPFALTSAEDAEAALLALLDELGFVPRAGEQPSEIELHHCPFRDVAEAHPEVACSLHLGLARGALDQMGGSLAVEELQPFVHPNRCVMRVRR